MIGFLKKHYMLLPLAILMLPFEAMADTFAKLHVVQQEYRSFISISPDNPYLPVVLLLGFMIVLATFYYPRFGLIVMLFFVFIATDMPVGTSSQSMKRPVSIRFEDIVLVLVSVGWIINRAKTRTLASIKNIPVYSPILMMAFVIVVATIIGYFQETVSPKTGFFYSMKRLEYFWIFFMAFNTMETTREAKRALAIMLSASFIIAIIGIIQSFFFPISELVQGGSTATTGYGRANTMGDFLIIVIGLSAGLMIYANTQRSIFLYSLLLSMLILSLIMTKSRGAYISIPPLLVVLFLITKNKKIVLCGISLIVILFFYIVASLYVPENIGRLLKTHDSEIATQFTQIGDVATKGPTTDPSLNSRIISWRMSFDEIRRYPFFGQGCGSKNLGYSDNQYFSEVLDTGIIGLLIFLYMNFMISWLVYKYFRATNDAIAKGMCAGFVSAHVGMMVHGITMTNFYTIFNMEVFWFSLSIIMVLLYNEKYRLHDYNATEQIQESGKSS